MSIDIKFINNLPPFMNDVPEIIRAFSPHIIIKDDAESFLELDISFFDNYINLSFKSNLFLEKQQRYEIINDDELVYKRLVKRFVKNALYSVCSQLTNVRLPYGSLTGVRPTKLFYELKTEGANARNTLISDYFVDPVKASLIAEVVKNQGIYRSFSDKSVGVYVNIPFCPSRCRYCSFISTEVKRVRSRIPQYLECLKKNISDIIKTIKQQSLKLECIYVGGGTPAVLEPIEILETFRDLSDFGVEFTFECGRPDVITLDKLKAMSDINVTRISINPQTFNPVTLERIGRNHSVEDVYRAFELARKFTFDINTDLIAGLEGENKRVFSDSLNKTLILEPENITIHTLSIKRGAVIRNEGAQKAVSGEVKEMTEKAYSRLTDSGYQPYYMYRQKNMSDNLENIGYSKLAKECIYNIAYMEELCTILSAGAGGVSKFVYDGGKRTERQSRPKDINLYLAD